MSTSINPQSRQRWIPKLCPARNADAAPLVIRSEGATLCGSAAEADLALDDPGVEPRHCRFAFSGGQLTVKPLDGSVFVNCVQVVEDSPVFVGDHVLIGTCTLRVDSADPALETSEPEQNMDNTKLPAGEEDTSRRAIQQHMSILERQLFGMRNRTAADVASESSSAVAAEPAPVPDTPPQSAAPAPSASEEESDESGDDAPCATIAAPAELTSMMTDEAEFRLEARLLEVNEREAVLKTQEAQLRTSQEELHQQFAQLEKHTSELQRRLSDVANRENQLSDRAEELLELETRSVNRDREITAEIERLAKDRDELKSRRETFEQREQEFHGREESLAQRESALQDRENELQSQADRRAEELNHREQQIAEREHQADARDHELAVRAEAQSGLDERAAQLDAERQEFEHRCHELDQRQQECDRRAGELQQFEDSLKQQQDDVARLQQELANQRTELEQRQSELNARDAADQGVNDELRRQLESAADELGRLTTTVDSLRQQQSDLESQHGELEAQRSELESQRSDLEAQHREVEAERDSLRSQVDELQSLARAAAEADEILRRVRDEAAAERERLEARIRELEATHESSASQEQELLDQVNTLQSELTAVRESRESAGQDLLDKVARQDELIERMTSQLAAAETALSSLDTSGGDSQKAEAENKELQLRLEQRDAQIRSLSAKLSNAEAAQQSGVSIERLAALTQELEERQTQLQRREEELNELQRQYDERQYEPSPASAPSPDADTFVEPQNDSPANEPPAYHEPDHEAPVAATAPEHEPVAEPVAESEGEGTYSLAASGVTHLRSELASLFGLGGASTASEPTVDPETSFESTATESASAVELPASVSVPEPVEEAPAQHVVADFLTNPKAAALGHDEDEESYLSKGHKTVSMNFADSADVLLQADPEPEPLTAEAAPEESSSPAGVSTSGEEGDQENDYVAKYMEELLARSRTGAGESLPSELNPSARRPNNRPPRPSRPTPAPAPRPVVPARTPASTGAPDVSGSPGVPSVPGTAVVSGAAPAAPAKPLPERRRADLDAMRQSMRSLRQVSAHSAQSALQSHAKKTHSNGIKGRWAVLLTLILITGLVIMATVMDAINSPLTIVVLTVCCLLSAGELRRKKKAIRLAAGEEPDTPRATVASQDASTGGAPAHAVPAVTMAGRPGVVMHAAPAGDPNQPVVGPAAYVQYHSR